MITIFSATNRNDSMTFVVSNLYSKLLNQNGVENQILDLRDLPNDFMFTNSFGASTDSFIKIVDKYLVLADRFIVVSPEYHGSYPGIFKAFMDCIGKGPVETKKVALVGVSSGRAGNLRGMEHLTGLFHHLRAEVFSLKPKISEIKKLINQDGVLDDKETVLLLENQLRQFLVF